VISFQYFGEHIEIFWKKSSFLHFYLFGIDTDPDRPDPNRQNDADPTLSLSGGYLPFIKILLSS
jgi:hypothetical protein